MAEAVQLAEAVRLTIKNGCIWPPHRWDRPYDQPEFNTPEMLLQWYEGRRTQFHTARQLVEDANSTVLEQFEKTAAFDWSTLVFASGDFVKNHIAELVKQGDHVSPVGLTSKVLRVGGPLLTLIGASYSLAKGDPPEEVLLVTGVSLVAGLVFVALTSGVAAPWLVATGATFAAAGAGEAVKRFTDIEETAREKLMRLSPAVDPGRVELDR